MEITIRKSDVKGVLKQLKKNPVLKKQDETWFFTLYQTVTASVTPRQWQKMLTELRTQKDNNEKSFQLAFKALIAISIYFSSVPFFGWALYLSVVIMLLLIMVALFWGYLLMEILPLALQQMYRKCLFIWKRLTGHPRCLKLRRYSLLSLFICRGDKRTAGDCQVIHTGDPHFTIDKRNGITPGLRKISSQNHPITLPLLLNTILPELPWSAKGLLSSDWISISPVNGKSVPHSLNEVLKVILSIVICPDRFVPSGKTM